MLKKTNQTAESRNQAVFLLTDTIPPEVDLTNIREDYERIYNDTNIQVDLFIYFIGKDIPETREFQWDKCLRNGTALNY